MRGTPGTFVAGWHSFRAAVLTVRAGFGMSDAEAARSVALARQALELETADGVTAHPHVPATLHRWPWPLAPGPWPLWTVLAVAGMPTVSLVEAGRGEEFRRVLREAGPAADAVERDGKEASTPGLAALGYAMTLVVLALYAWRRKLRDVGAPASL